MYGQHQFEDSVFELLINKFQLKLVTIPPKPTYINQVFAIYNNMFLELV